MKKMVVTGATGFIGGNLVKKACDNGWTVTAVVRNSSRAGGWKSLPGVSLLELEMKDYQRMGDILGPADCFVHLAWNGIRGTSRMDRELQESNYVYSVNAIKSMITAGCKKVLTAGSQAEYGISDKKVTEDADCLPNTEYGKYKLRLYEEMASFCGQNQVDFKEARIFSLYGPGDHPDSLIMSLLNRMSSDRECRLTECTQMWDYLYVEDAVDAILLLCDEECSGGAYNIGSGDIRMLRDYIEEIKGILKSKSKIVYGAVPYPASGKVSIQPDIGKLRRETGWSAKVSFGDGIRRTMPH